MISEYLWTVILLIFLLPTKLHQYDEVWITFYLLDNSTVVLGPLHHHLPIRYAKEPILLLTLLFCSLGFTPINETTSLGNESNVIAINVSKPFDCIWHERRSLNSQYMSFKFLFKLIDLFQSDRTTTMCSNSKYRQIHFVTLVLTNMRLKPTN